MSHNIKVGDVIHGFHKGLFGRDSYGCRRVEAVGADWVLTRKIERQTYESEIEVTSGRQVLDLDTDLTCGKQWPGMDVDCPAFWDDEDAQ